LLRDIERALAKLDSGDFGICEGTGERIEPLRWLARPWTRYSVAYLEEREEAAKRHLM
jgi:DnaK suppressor protein